MNLGSALLRVLAPDETLVTTLQDLASLRGRVGPRIEITGVGGSVDDVLRSLRASGIHDPLGYVGHSEPEAFTAIAAGADEACTAEGLDLPRFVSFLDRVAFRAAHRRESELRCADVAHREKLAALGTVVAGVAHEINNPLAVILMLGDAVRSILEPLLSAQHEIFRLTERGTSVTRDELIRLAALARTGAVPAELRSILDDIAGATKTIAEIVRDLRIFARAENAEREEPVFLPDLADHVLRIVGSSISSIATLERDYAQELPVLVLPRTRIAQVLTNLLINASHAIASVPRPTHRVRVTIRSDAEAVAVSVADSGPGIPPAIIERIFDPFFTTKTASSSGPSGTGLGLSISRSILQSLGGDLVVESIHGTGATFVAIIPTAGRTSASRKPEWGSRIVTCSPTVAHRPAVLVVDDEEALLRSIAIALRGRFDVILASDGQEAIDLLTSGSRPEAIVCDIAMPIVDGIGVFDWLERHHPNYLRRTVFLTGNPNDTMAMELGRRSGKPALDKPIGRDRLVRAIEDIVDSGHVR